MRSNDGRYAPLGPSMTRSTGSPCAALLTSNRPSAPTTADTGGVVPMRSAAVSGPGASPSIMYSRPDAETGGAGGAGAMTNSVRSPRFPSLVASITVTPGATPVARPDCVTVATVGSRDVHAIGRPLSTAPLASNVVALNCWLAPTTTLGIGDVT